MLGIGNRVIGKVELCKQPSQLSTQMTTEPHELLLHTDYPPDTYFASVLKNTTYAEIWRITKPNPLVFAIGAAMKTLRVNIAPNIAMAIGGFRKVSLEEVPDFVHDHFETEIADLLGRGYSPLFAGEIPVIGDGDNCTLYYVGPRFDRGASCVYFRETVNGTDNVESGVSIAAKLENGDFVAATNNKSVILPRQGFDVAIRPQWEVRELDDLLSTRLASAGSSPVPFSAETAWSRIVEAEQLVFGDLLKRGILRPVTEKEHDILARRA